MIYKSDMFESEMGLGRYDSDSDWSFTLIL